MGKWFVKWMDEVVLATLLASLLWDVWSGIWGASQWLNVSLALWVASDVYGNWVARSNRRGRR